jgi:hypothetical protein
MPENPLNARSQSGESDKSPGYIKEKIRASNPKNRGVESPARAWGRDSTRRIIKRAEKKLTAVLKQFPSDAVNKAIEVLEGQLEATKQIWDVNARCLIDIPDEKIRQDAALAILAYEWGTPVQRKIVANVNEETFEERLRKMRESSRYKQLQNSEHSIVKGKVIDGEVGSVPNPAVGSSGE